MSETPIQEVQAEAQPTLPICPHCLADPFHMRAHPTDTGILRAIVFSCSSCRKVVSVFLLPARIQNAPPRMFVP